MFKSASLQNDFEQLPDRPGVYIFKDKQGSVLYVGKANSLKKRVSSYSRLNPNDWKLGSLVGQATNIDSRETGNPLDAMILEAQLIQNHQPKFNIMLKGGRPFLYFVFTKTEVPELLLTRSKSKKGFYIGPFVHRSQARAIFDMLTRNFRLRICHKKIEGGCMYFHIGQCPGSCRSDFDVNAYKTRLKKVQKLLGQGPDKIIKELENEVKKSDEQLEFERSKILTSQLEQIKEAGQMLEHAGLGGKDGTSMLPEDEKHVWIAWPGGKVLEMFYSRAGVVRKKELWFAPQEAGIDPEEYFKNYYTNFACPNSIFTNFPITELDTVEKFLAQWHGKASNVAIIDRIDETPPDFVALAQTMAKSEIDALEQAPLKIAKLVGAKKPVTTIDCFDVSHRQGQSMVGSCIRFRAGRPDKDNFRRFKIKTVEGQDDYASLREIVSRRYKDGTQDLPDLVLIDGGKGQRSSVQDLVGITPLAALAKREERLFCVANLTEGVKLDRKSAHGALLIALRDYTHHFAITYHRKLQN